MQLLNLHWVRYNFAQGNLEWREPYNDATN